MRPTPISLTGSRTRTSRRRQLGHVLLGVASWIALAALWVWQLATYVPANWLDGVELIGALLAGWVCFSVVWVAWCRDIYRRRHTRTTPLKRTVEFEHDTLGRPVLAPPGIAGARGQVLISVSEDGVKRYRIAPPHAVEHTSERAA